MKDADKRKRTERYSTRLPEDRTPPHSPEAEAAILGTILQDGEVLTLVVDLVRPDDFYLAANRKVFEGMLRLYEKGRTVDTVVLTDELRDEGELERIGGIVYLADLEARGGTTASLEHYAKIVRDKSMVRKMIRAASTIVSGGYLDGVEADDFLEHAEHLIYSVGDERLRRQERRLGELVEEAYQIIKERSELGQRVTGIPTDYAGLDGLLLGFQPSDMIVLAARPGMGKTAFALNLAINASCRGAKNYAVLFCSLEMDEHQLTNRIISMLRRIDLQRLRKGFTTDAELDAIAKSIKELKDRPLFIDDSAKLSVMDLRARARRMKARGELDMVIVDYLQLMEPSDKGTSREQQISEISRSLKALAKELEIPVIALAQLSRAPETRTGSKRPLLSDLRESGAIEQDADVVLFLYRQEYYDRDDTKPEDRGVMEVIVAKQRNGPTGNVKLGFLPATMEVTNLRRAEVEP